MNNILKKGQKINNGDVIKGQFSLYVDGIKQNEYSKDLEYKVGTKAYIDRLDHFLIGRNFKPSMEVTFVFPKNYTNTQWSNKKVLVKIDNAHLIKLKEINKHLNDENYKNKAQIDELIAENTLLKLKVQNLESEIRNSAELYIQKAKELTSKAQEEIEKNKQNNSELVKNEVKLAKMYALQSFAEDFLVPYNNFKLATIAGENSSDPSVQNYVYGFKMIDRQFVDIFNQHGLEIIEAIPGSEFNPEDHHAIDVVIDELQKDNSIKQNKSFGVKLNGRVVKPALVVIYKNK